MKSNLSKNNYRYLIEILVAGVLVSVGSLWVAPGPLFTMIMQDYSINSSTVGLTTSIVALIMAISSFLSGFLVNRIGLKRTFAIGAFLLAGSVFTPFASNILQLLIMRFVFAVGVALTIPLASGIVMQWFASKEIPLVNGINMSAASAGNTIAMFASVGIAAAFDWKIALALYAIFALIFALLWVMLGRERIPDSSGVSVETGIPSVNVGSILKQKNTLLLGLCMAGPFLAFNGVMSWLPTYYSENFGMPLSTASSITGVANLFGIPISILGSFMIMRLGLRKPFVIVPGLLIGFSVLGAFLVNNLIIIYISIAIFGMCFFIFQPVLVTMAMELPQMTPQRAVTVIAIALAIGNLGGFIGPLVIGFLYDLSGSYLTGLLVCSILSWSLLAGGLLLPETGIRAKR